MNEMPTWTPENAGEKPKMYPERRSEILKRLSNVRERMGGDMETWMNDLDNAIAILKQHVEHTDEGTEDLSEIDQTLEKLDRLLP